MTAEEKFNANVERSEGCYGWKGYKHSAGYGLFAIGKKKFYAHRFAWERINGPIPKGMQILHKCDNPPCTNLDHLFIGTFKDNMIDKVKKGRQSHKGRGMRGEANGRHKITFIEALEIRTAYATGKFTQKELGARFGIDRSQVSHVVTNKHWKG